MNTEQFEAELVILSKLPTEVHFSLKEATALIGLLQLACRHPELPFHVRTFAEGMAIILADGINRSGNFPNVMQVIEEGWQR